MYVCWITFDLEIDVNSNTELIADLQSNIVGDPFPLMRKAADAIEVLQAEVERLKAFAGGYANENLRLQAQLAAAQGQQPSVPEGWKLVPVEPTHLQAKAAADAWLGCDSKLYLNKAMAAAKAMLSAAPQPKDMK